MADDTAGSSTPRRNQPPATPPAPTVRMMQDISSGRVIRSIAYAPSPASVHSTRFHPFPRLASLPSHCLARLLRAPRGLVACLRLLACWLLTQIQAGRLMLGGRLVEETRSPRNPLASMCNALGTRRSASCSILLIAFSDAAVKGRLPLVRWQLPRVPAWKYTLPRVGALGFYGGL